jgi:hypothetical protein
MQLELYLGQVHVVFGDDMLTSISGDDVAEP